MKAPWSIASLLRKEERDWFRSNDLRRRLRYGWFAREILKGGEHPVRYAFTLSALFVLIILLTYLVSEDWFVVRSWSSRQASEQLTYFTSLWAVQATIVALVYPFIIAFVALFLDRQPSSKALLQIYLVDSGGLAAGLSSLFLVLVMAVQYILLISPYFLSHSMTWIAVDSVWFVYNLVLTSWFLFRTVEFLHSDFQMKVIRQYAANVALPREIANLLRFQFFASAQKKGWIPGPEYLNGEAEGQPQVLMRSFGVRMGEVSVRRYLREQCRLTNILFWPLRIVIRGWLNKAHKVEFQVSGLANKPKLPLLVLPVIPGGIYESEVVLARVDFEPKLSSWQRLFVWMSFRFRRLRLEHRYVTAAEILADLETDARVAAGSGNVAGFEQAYVRVTELHRTLLGASLAKIDDGRMGSWALVPDIFSFIDRPVHEHWATTYRSLFDAAVSLLPREARPIRRLCHVVQHLDGPDLQRCPVEIRERILMLPTQLLYLLGTWWSQRVEEQGVLQHGSNEMALLRPPLQGAYEESLLHFVGAWDSARRVVANFPNRNGEFVWANAKDFLKLNTTHINHTCLMLLRAVARGDQAAAEWLADVISKWGGDASVYDAGPSLLYEKSNFITVQVVSRPWSAAAQSLGIDENDRRFLRTDKSVLQKYVCLTALKNYWWDIRVLTLEILLSWAAREESGPRERSLAVYVATGLLVGRQWRSGGRIKQPLSQLTASNYLTAKARQYSADSSYRQGYVAQLDSFVESAKDIVQPEMVPGRLYSYSGADDVESLQDAQLLILILLSDAPWRLGESLRRQIAIWTASNFQSTEMLMERAEAMKKRLDEVQEGFYPRLIEQLLSQTGKTHTLSEGLGRTRDALDALLTEIRNLQSEAVASAEVSPQRLQEIENAASEEGFSRETGQFPLQLFSSIVHADAPQETFSFIISKLRKGEFTDVEMAQRAVNESEYYSRAVAEGVGQTLLWDVIRQSEVRDVVAPDADSYWLALKAEAKKLKESGLTPLLILDNPTRPDWIWEWQHPDGDSIYPRPPDLSIRHEEERGDGYVIDFNEIAVFSGPLSPGESFLLARESFAGVTFRNYRTNVFVKAEVSEVAESRTLINLRLTFERSVKIGHTQIVRIKYQLGDGDSQASGKSDIREET
jgi:hypothetical protein